MDDQKRREKEEKDKARKLELEAKKKKLEEMRRQKEAGTKLAATTSIAPPVTTPLGPIVPPTAPTSESIDDILRSVVGDVPATKPTDIPDQETTSPDGHAAQSPSESQTLLAPRKMPVLTLSSVVEISILSKSAEYYSKEVQTEESYVSTLHESQQAAAGGVEGGADGIGQDWDGLGMPDHAPIDLDSHLDGEGEKQSEIEYQIKELSAGEKRQIMTRPDFEDFMHKAMRMVDDARAPRMIVDYANKEATASVESGGQKISLNLRFYDEKWTKNRAVTSLQWNPKHPEMLLSSYHSKTDTISKDPEGVVLLWTTHNPTRPEYVLTCQSPVSRAMFSRFSPTVVIGGTYLGQIVLWDFRAKSSPVLAPSQVTPISPEGHYYPIFGMEIVGTTNANNLITMSSNGRVCSWNTDKLHKPLDNLDLFIIPQDSKGQKKDVGGHVLTFPESEQNKFLFGSEDGAIYSAQRLGSKAGINEVFQGHASTITSIDFHPSSVTYSDHSNIFLSSSMDWSVKLWNSKPSNLSQPIEPICSFEEYEDYVYDARWSPAHPGMFATADGTGRLKLWNITEDIDNPLFEVEPSRLTNPHYTEPLQSRALHRLRWSQDGRKIAAGDSAGYIHVLDVSSDIATPQPADFGRFDARLQSLLS